MSPIEQEYPLVVCMIKGVPYAITSQHVRSMTEVPDVVPVPSSPSYVRGLINLRGEVLPLVDLRMKLGLTSIKDEILEFTRMLNTREQDHRNWLSELEASVREQREFTLTTDPHQCAFGKWYDNYHAEDLTAGYILRQFDQPHKLIHGVADKVGQLVSTEDFDGAHHLIDKTRGNQLNQMIHLFRNTTEHYNEMNHEIALVLETPGFNFAISVDSVEAVEFLKDESIQNLPMSNPGEQNPPLASMLGRRVNDGTVVQIVDVEQICTPEEIENLQEAECPVP